MISAASQNHLDVVKYLADRGANLETSDIVSPKPNRLCFMSNTQHTIFQDGQTALMKAVAGEHLAIVEYLCALGVDVNVRNNVSIAFCAIHLLIRSQKCIF